MRREFGTVIVGTGFSGLGLAIQLKKRGRHDFVVLEKADEVGGTWRDNTYPGCACDVPSHMYSYSFAKNAGWSQQWSKQPEILAYLKRLADKHGVYEHVRFGSEVNSAIWDDRTARWIVGTTNGSEYVGRFLAAGVGALHIPSIPALEGLDTFAGAAFHSAQWDHDYDLTGKRVAVIGTGASAIQFVPKIARQVAHLDLYQRTAPWVLPRTNFAIPGPAKQMFRRVPGAMWAYRNAIYWAAESAGVGFNGHSGLLRLAERVGRRHIARQLNDPVLREKVTPDYTLGCKRVLGSNTYYPALARANVDVVTDAITEIRPHSVVTADGTEREVDAIIYGTGFHVTDAFEYLDVRGRGGADLREYWQQQGIQTHLGVTVAGFPNLFFLLGPNTGLGHNSVVFMIESQIHYVLEAMSAVERRGADAVEVTSGAQSTFNEQVQRKLANGVWSTGGCTSWYLDSQGVNRTVWPGATWRYWMQTRRFNEEDHTFTTTTEGQEPWTTTAPRRSSRERVQGSAGR